MRTKGITIIMMFVLSIILSGCDMSDKLSVKAWAQK